MDSSITGQEWVVASRNMAWKDENPREVGKCWPVDLLLGSRGKTPSLAVTYLNKLTGEELD
jgi:hypothetical protein